MSNEKFSPTGSIAIKSAAEAKRYLGSAVSVWNRESKVIAERDNTRTVAAAVAIHAAVRTGYLGKVVTGEVVGKMFDRSNAWVSSMRTLGIAFVDLRIDPMSDTGRALANGGAQIREVSAAIKAEGATVDTVTKALADMHVGIDGKKTPTAAKKTDKRATGGTTAQTAPEGTPTLPRNNSGRIDLVEQALAAMSKPSKAERDRLAVVFGAWVEAFGLTLPEAAPEAVAS